MNRRTWIDIEPGKHCLSAYEVSKKVIHLLRHSQQVHREEDGAVHFWRIKVNLQNPFPQSIHWSDDRWKACLESMLGSRRRSKKEDSSTALIFQEQLFMSELFKNIQDAILLILLLQDNVVIQSGFFQHIYHIGCAFNLHSIINNAMILGGQNSSKRQTVFFPPVDPGDKKVTRILKRLT